YGPAEFGRQRAEVEAQLSQLAGKQLAIVHYSEKHYPLDEWVYNAPDIDHSKVIWAREMDEASNRELIDHYRDRHVWLVQPDNKPVSIRPYPMGETEAAASLRKQSPTDN